MASFTSQAGIADINNTAALVRAIATAPTKNPFIGIKLPESLQSENSTDNALKKLKMRTETVRANSIVSGDKLAVQKLDMLKAKNKFDMGMSEKEYTLKDNMQTFNIGNTTRLTDNTISVANAGVQHNRDTLQETKDNNERNYNLKDWDQTARIAQAALNENNREADRGRTYQLAYDKSILDAQKAGHDMNMSYQTYLSTRDKNDLLIEEATWNMFNKNRKFDAERAKEKDIENAAINAIELQNVTNNAPGINTHEDVITKVTSGKSEYNTGVDPAALYDAIEQEVNADPSLNPDQITDSAKEFLKKKAVIEQKVKDGKINEADAILRVAQLAKKTDIVDSSGKLVKLSSKADDRPLKEREADREAELEAHNTKWKGLINRIKNQIPVRHFSGPMINITRPKNRKPLTAAENALVTKMEEEKANILLKNNLTDPLQGKIDRLVKKQKTSAFARENKREELAERAIDMFNKNTTFRTTTKDVTTRELRNKEDYNKGVEKQVKDMITDVTSRLQKKSKITGASFKPSAINDSLKRIKEWGTTQKANYAEYAALVATSQKRKLNHQEARDLARLKSLLKTEEQSAEYAAKVGLEKVKGKNSIATQKEKNKKTKD